MLTAACLCIGSAIAALCLAMRDRHMTRLYRAGIIGTRTYDAWTGRLLIYSTSILSVCLGTLVWGLFA